MFVQRFDATGDGVVDNADMVDFLDLVRDGDLAADLNRDGSADDVDIQLFTERVANGENVMPEEFADMPEIPGGGGPGGRGRGGPGGGGGGPRGG